MDSFCNFCQALRPMVDSVQTATTANNTWAVQMLDVAFS
jgi:hypothetical protein